VRHPIEIYTELLRLLTDCLHAPVATVRLSGGDPGTGTQVGMARRLVQEAAREPIKAVADRSSPRWRVVVIDTFIGSRCDLHHGFLLSPAQEDVADRRDGRPVIQNVGAFGDRPRTLDGLRLRERDMFLVAANAISVAMARCILGIKLRAGHP
jgi:hypothetical protein